MDAPVRILAFAARRLIVRASSPTSLAWFTEADLPAPPRAVVRIHRSGTSVVELEAREHWPEEWKDVSLRRALSDLPAEAAAEVLRAAHLLYWERNHRHCGRCGAPTVEVETEQARRCPACGTVAFPRISPAVIMLVDRDGGRQILLGRSQRAAPGLFSTLAGFVEPGESLEASVRREIREEAGIELGEVRYFGSQPWPFPDSLMVGFRAEWRSGEIDFNREELAEARWFGIDELPAVPPGYSIARALIDAWVRERGGDPTRLQSWPVPD